MKRIILFLALLSLGVSKAQVVGGYLPINSTKSATMGGLRVNGNETVTGTFSVGSAAIITGALKASSTMSLGSANLTGGNTGTVAVLSDAVFCVSIKNDYNSVTALNFADATTYYWGNAYSPTTNSLNGQFKLPYNCTLVGWDFFATPAAVASSSETGTLSIAGTTNYTMSTAITFSTAYNNYYANGLSQSFNANDLLNIKFLTPTWATNPTQLFIGINLWFVRHQ